MTAETGWRNDWRCPDGHEMRCVTVNQGATPMFMGCLIEVDGSSCGKRADSQFHTRQWSDEPPEYEWFKRDPLSTDNPGVRDHLERGGLALRRMSDGVEV